MKDLTLAQLPQATAKSSATALVSRRALLSGVAFTSIALLSGCLIPEKFVAKVEVEPDAGYTFHYAGTVIHAMAAAHIKQAGSLSPKDEASLQTEAEKMTKRPDVQKAVYKGSGRYDLEIESHKKAGQSLQMFDVFTVRTDKDGIMTITSSELKDKDKREFDKLGIVVDGTLEVRVPKNAEIISSNATSTPTFGFGVHSWKIGHIDQRPALKLRFKQ